MAGRETLSRAERLRASGRLLIALVSLLVMVGTGLAWATMSSFTSHIPHGASVPALVGSDLDGKAENILLLGNDSRAGASKAELKALLTEDDGGSVNTDTMMVLHLPADGSKATVVSFPRDSWVDVPGYGKRKINTAYPEAWSEVRNRGGGERAAESAGIELLIQTINALTGLHIDHYVQVNLLGFYRISNAIGGVEVCLVHAQNPSTDADQFGRGYSGIDLPAGTSVIRGSQALAFVRQRHGLPNGDLDRVRRQQYFLGAAFRKLTSGGVLLNPFKLHDLLGAISSSMLTDPELDVTTLARQFTRLGTGDVTFQTIPNSGPQTIYPDGIETAIVAVDTAQMPAFIARLQGKNADPALAAAPTADPAAVSLDVLNATAAAGLANSNATVLRTRGFHVENIDSTAPSTFTVIEYPDGGQSGAKALAAAVPGAKLIKTPRVARVTLVLGSDGILARSVTPGQAASAVPVHPAASPAAAAPTPAAKAGTACID